MIVKMKSEMSESLLEKVNNSFCDIAEVLMESKSTSDCSIELTRMCSLLIGNYDLSSSVGKYRDTITNIVLDWLTNDSCSDSTCLAMMKLLQLFCTVTGPENDEFCCHLVSRLTEHRLFLRFGATIQLSILETIGYCSLICSTVVDECQAQFCEYILTTEALEWTTLPEWALVKAGALRCWSMLAISKDTLWNDAGRFILDTIVELLTCNNVFIIEQCGLALCRIIETVQYGPSEHMVAMQEYITLFIQRANELVIVPKRSECHGSTKSLLVKCVHMLYNNGIHNVSGLIVTDVLHQLSGKSMDRWMQCYSYIEDIICPNSKVQWHNDLQSDVEWKHSHMSKLMSVYQHNLQLEEKQTRWVARCHPQVITAGTIHDEEHADASMIKFPLPSKNYQPSVGKSMKYRNLTRHVINREKSIHIRKGRIMKERFQLGDSVITSQFFA